MALAVRINYQAHGRDPTKMADVSRRWLPRVPSDVWDQSIAYRLKDGKPVIYSLGPDGKDDAGRPTDPFKPTKGDLVFGKLTRRLNQK